MATARRVAQRERFPAPSGGQVFAGRFPLHVAVNRAASGSSRFSPIVEGGSAAHAIEFHATGRPSPARPALPLPRVVARVSPGAPQAPAPGEAQQRAEAGRNACSSLKSGRQPTGGDGTRSSSGAVASSSAHDVLVPPAKAAALRGPGSEVGEGRSGASHRGCPASSRRRLRLHTIRCSSVARAGLRAFPRCDRRLLWIARSRRPAA
jgi:hypothetical protein